METKINTPDQINIAVFFPGITLLGQCTLLYTGQVNFYKVQETPTAIYNWSPCVQIGQQIEFVTINNEVLIQ